MTDLGGRKESWRATGLKAWETEYLRMLTTRTGDQEKWAGAGKEREGSSLR